MKKKKKNRLKKEERRKDEMTPHQRFRPTGRHAYGAPRGRRNSCAPPERPAQPPAAPGGPACARGSHFRQVPLAGAVTAATPTCTTHGTFSFTPTKGKKGRWPGRKGRGGAAAWLRPAPRRRPCPGVYLWACRAEMTAAAPRRRHAKVENHVHFVSPLEPVRFAVHPTIKTPAAALAGAGRGRAGQNAPWSPFKGPLPRRKRHFRRKHCRRGAAPKRALPGSRNCARFKHSFWPLEPEGFRGGNRGARAGPRGLARAWGPKEPAARPYAAPRAPLPQGVHRALCVSFGNLYNGVASTCSRGDAPFPRHGGTMDAWRARGHGA